jgi:hypothetical protein
METVAITLALLGTSGLLAYLSSQFKSTSEGGSKYASVMKILFNATSFTLLLLVPAAGLVIAESISSSGLNTILTVSLIPTVFLYVVFVFYLIWEYLSGLINVVSGGDRIESEQVR